MLCARKTPLLLAALLLASVGPSRGQDKGWVGTYGDKYMWTGTGETFVPNFVMYGPNDGPDLRDVTRANFRAFLDEMMDGHGFNGVHLPVYGQWFHIGVKEVTQNDTEADPATLDKVAMIIEEVYARGGCTHLWAWGDAARHWNAAVTRGGIMGAQERAVWDAIAERLGPLRGWTVGYGFDLYEWVTENDLRAWYEYLQAKPGFRHLMGARSQKNAVDQIFDGLDVSSYENHKPDYDMYVQLLNHLPEKPSFSEDRFRIRGRTKDYTPEETRRGLWNATMAGGVAGIWGNLGSESGTSHEYPNREEILCYFTFWRGRFLRDMQRANDLTNGYALRNGTSHYVFYKTSTDRLTYSIAGTAKRVVAVDARAAYREVDLGTQSSGDYVFDAPRSSDWAIAVGDFGSAPEPDTVAPAAPRNLTVR